MKVRRWLLGVIGSLLFSLSTVAGGTVFAMSPEFEYFHDAGTFVAVDCGTFLAIEDYSVDISVATFFDQQGEPERAQIRVNFDGLITNSETGLALRDHAPHMYVEDLRDGTVTDVGLEFAITVPGEGITILDAGRLIFDEEGHVLFQGGPHQFLDGGPTLICAALD